MTLKIEVGKTYVTKDGTPVKILRNDGDETWPFDASDGMAYRADGGYWSEGDSVLDLVAELQPPAE